MNQSKTLSQAIGGRIRDLREGSGLRQEDIASSARRKGLPWTRATVASIESGKRRLSMEEMTLLPFVLLSSCCHLPGQQGKFIQISDLIPQQGWVSMTAQTNIHAQVIRWVWHSQAESASQQDIDSPDEREFKQNIPVFMSERLMWSEAAEKAARKLKVSPLEIEKASDKLWSRSLAEERDLRISERMQGKDLRTIQALRGHVTRALLGELRSILKSKARPKKTKRR
jgi:helix-turn-helix protein